MVLALPAIKELWGAMSDKEKKEWYEQYLEENPEKATAALKLKNKTPRARAAAFNTSTKLITDLVSI